MRVTTYRLRSLRRKPIWDDDNDFGDRVVGWFCAFVGFVAIIAILIP